MAHKFFNRRGNSQIMQRGTYHPSPFVSLGKIITYKLAGIDVVVKTLDALNGVINKKSMSKIADNKDTLEISDILGKSNINTTIINLIEPPELRSVGSHNLNVNAKQRRDGESGHSSSCSSHRSQVMRNRSGRRQYLKPGWPKDSYRTQFSKRNIRSEAKSSGHKVKFEDRNSPRRIVFPLPSPSSSKASEVSALKDPKHKPKAVNSHNSMASTSRTTGAPSGEVLNQKPLQVKEEKHVASSGRTSKRRHRMAEKKTKFLEDLPLGNDPKKVGSRDKLEWTRSSLHIGRYFGKQSPPRKKDDAGSNLLPASKMTANGNSFDLMEGGFLFGGTASGAKNLHITKMDLYDKPVCGLKRPWKTMETFKGDLGGEISDSSGTVRHTTSTSNSQRLRFGESSASEPNSNRQELVAGKDPSSRSTINGPKSGANGKPSPKSISNGMRSMADEGSASWSSSDAQRFVADEKPASRSWAAVARGTRGGDVSTPSMPVDPGQDKVPLMNQDPSQKDPRDFPSLGETQWKETKRERYCLRRGDELDSNTAKATSKLSMPSQFRKQYNNEASQLFSRKAGKTRRNRQKGKRHLQVKKKLRMEQVSQQATSKIETPSTSQISWRIDDMREVATHCEKENKNVPLLDKNNLLSKSDICNRLGAIAVNSNGEKTCNEEKLHNINFNRKRKEAKEMKTRGYKSLLKYRTQKDASKSVVEDNGTPTKKISTRYRALLRRDYGKVDVKTATELFNKDRWMPSHQKDKILEYKHQRREQRKQNNSRTSRNERESSDPVEGTSRRVHWDTPTNE